VTSSTIDYVELLNTFSTPTLAQALVRIHNTSNTYILQLAWDQKDTPFNQQIIWLIYNPDSIKPIENLLETIRHLAHETNQKIIFMDNYDPSRHYLMDIILCCDGEGITQTYTHHIQDTEGHIGVITGQGRDIDINDPSIRNIIHATLTNFLLRFKKLQNDPYLKQGKNPLHAILTVAKQIGLKTRHITQAEVQKEVSAQHG